MTPAQNTAAYIQGFEDGRRAAKAEIKRELAKQEQGEPVAWMRQDGQRVTTASDRHNYPDYETRYSIPLYTHPQPKREWVGLNWDDLPEIYVGDTAFLHGAKWAEAKLKEKNT